MARATRKPSRAAARKRASLKLQNLHNLTADLRPVVRKNKKRAERLIDEVLKRKARISEDFFQIGLALKQLSAPALYSAAGYDSFKKLVIARKLMNPNTAYKLITVVDTYPKSKARKIGFEKAYALTRYVAATPAADLATTLVDLDPIIGRTALSDMSVRQVRQATARIRKATTKKKDPEATAARRAARALQRTLRAAGAKSASVQAVRVEGRWQVRTEMDVEDTEHWT